MSEQPGIPAALAGRIAERLRSLSHLEPSGSGTFGDLAVEQADMGLALEFESGSETIRRARFWAPQSAPEAAILDVLCDYAGGVPARELIEHGLNFALQRLRDPAEPAPVRGILTPRNAGACFSVPLKLVAALRRKTEARFGRHSDTNFFDRPYSDTWKELDRTGKRNLVLPHIESFKAAHEIAANAFELVEIDQYDRLFLVFDEEIPVWDKPGILMHLERHLRDKTGERIELFTEVVKDANRIRRL
ncbi:hypothetical protein [Nisaea sp.]|uniref:hypothetical protein n=1 Tax=Nisaea sp. TaxID=2024842 RepID=UPI003B526FAF